MAVRGRFPHLLWFVGGWLRSLQCAESQSHTEELRSDDDKVIQPQRLPSCLLETNTIRRLEPLSIAEAMERLPIPAVRAWEGSSPNLAEITCHVLANNSHGIIRGHLSVNSSLQGYHIGIEARVSAEVGNKILGSLQESIDSF